MRIRTALNNVMTGIGRPVHTKNLHKLKYIIIGHKKMLMHKKFLLSHMILFVFVYTYTQKSWMEQQHTGERKKRAHTKNVLFYIIIIITQIFSYKDTLYATVPLYEHIISFFL